jgi:hypothetical protein
MPINVPALASFPHFTQNGSPRSRSGTLAYFPFDIDPFSKCDHSPLRYTPFNHPERNL